MRAIGLFIFMSGSAFAQAPSTTKPPMHPKNASEHTITITADDLRDGTRKFTVTVSPKAPNTPAIVEQGYLTVRDGDKYISACQVQAEKQGFTFTVAAAYFEKSGFGFTVATASAEHRKKLPSAAGWVRYEFTLKDYTEPSKKEVPLKEPAPTKVIVNKTSLTFDPKSAEGKGMFFWGLGSCEVKVIGRKDSHCVFEYTQEVEMGSTVYLVKVPLDYGPVSIRIESITKDGSTYQWPVTSFALDKARVIRESGGRGIMSVRVGETESFIKLHPSENRSEMAPRKGDAVKFRFTLMTGADFKERLPNAVQRSAEFEAGSESLWPWLAIAMDGMTVGDRQHVEVPLDVADGAKAWLPKGNKATVLYMEVDLLSTERKK